MISLLSHKNFIFTTKKDLRILPIIFLLFFLHLSGSKTQAQLWEVGAKIGGTGYMGDLNPDKPFQYNQIGGGIYGKRNFNPTWGIRAVLNYVPVKWSGESTLVFPNEIEFQNKIFEVAVLGEFNFKKFYTGGAFTPYTPYVFAGVGFFTHNPKLPGVSENSSASAVSIPFGLGIRLPFKNSSLPLSVGAELMYSFAFTNKIDGVAGYTKPEEDTPLPIQNGSGYPYDGFMSASISITYTFLSDKCIWW